MAGEYNVPWERKGDYIITGNGKIHKDDTEKIVNQRDHEVNNLRQVNQCLKMGFLVDKDLAPSSVKRDKGHSFLSKYLVAL